MRYCTVDFETTTDPDDCRVWAIGLWDVYQEKYEDWNNLKAFIADISRDNAVMWFHNLAFDGVFLIDYLLKNGYTHTLADSPTKGEFTTLISNDGKFYNLCIRWKTGKYTEFQDSLKKFPNMSVAKIAKAFKLAEVKGELDYDKYRPVNHRITPVERDYLRRDVLIVGRAIRQVLDNGMRKLTIGADSLEEFKRLTPAFEHTFPILDIDTDTEIRRAYRGGFTYADPRRIMVETGEGMVFDVNSLYPHMMYAEELPYGEPQEFFGKPLKDCAWIATARLTAVLYDDHIPCIQIKNNLHFLETEYLREISEPTELTFTNVDWDLWNRQYHIEVDEWKGGYYFKSCVGLFREYIDKWTSIKESSVGGQREIAKLHLNTLYGKFATNPKIVCKIPYLKNDTVAMKIGEPETRNPVYTPVGVFITSHARNFTVSAAQKHYDRFCYADTDSLHLIGTEMPDIEIDDRRRGAWKLEEEFIDARFIRAKAYMELLKNGKYSVHIAGLPREIAEQMTFDDIVNGRVIKGKLHPKRVPGGVVLQDVGFRLNIPQPSASI